MLGAGGRQLPDHVVSLQHVGDVERRAAAVCRAVDIDHRLSQQVRKEFGVFLFDSQVKQRVAALAFLQTAIIISSRYAKNPKFLLWGSGLVRFLAKPGFWFGSFLLGLNSLPCLISSCNTATVRWQNEEREK